MCVSGAVNNQCFVWKFFYALYTNFHSFIHQWLLWGAGPYRRCGRKSDWGCRKLTGNLENVNAWFPLGGVAAVLHGPLHSLTQTRAKKQIPSSQWWYINEAKLDRGKNRFSTYLSDEGGAYGQSLVRVCFVTVPGTDSCHCCAKHWYFYILHNYLLFCHRTTGMKWHLYYLQWACIQFNQSDDAVNNIIAPHAAQAWWDNYAPRSNSRVGHSVAIGEITNPTDVTLFPT